MKNYIKNKKYIFELGSGNGASKDILENKKIILTDIQKYLWIDRKVDVTKLNLGKKYKKKHWKVVRPSLSETRVIQY